MKPSRTSPATAARKRAPAAAPGTRRRPRQERARHTARALREAFVQVLVERRSYAAVTVREVSLVAGTAIGSFYDYYSSMDDLARVSLHLRSKALLAALRGAGAEHEGAPLAEMMQAIVRAVLARHQRTPREWAAHYLLERHFSSLQAYLAMYERFVQAWAHAIETASDWPEGHSPATAALGAQTLLYGLVAHACMAAPEGPDMQALERIATRAIIACMHAAQDE
ncbi:MULTISPECIES: TetR family transcriptional regulator [unclassified Comamonas]|uniref:TetR/AcrR family transcriptional regulator n=1 Tax=unclassified Comamonas TaxID=2638500 RepID=UPI001AC2EF69|nr:MULTISPECIES: TetR family transcriptional regulator [unclassified Comamonas]MBN9330834.1 TetR family transcriptional regulator [Comamonas sp.]